MGKVNRAQWVTDIMTLVDVHKITVQQAVGLIARAHSMEWSFTARELFSLIKKQLLSTDHHVVNSDRFFRPLTDAGSEEEDIAKELLYTKSKRATNDSLTIANNLFKKLVPAEYQEKKYISTLARKNFLGEYDMAKCYITFRHLFPTGDLQDDFLWNRHFGITYQDTNRWEEKPLIRSKFRVIYKTKDIGLFLQATYFAVKNSVKEDLGTAYMSKVSNYLLDYEKWMTLAKKKTKATKSTVVERPIEQSM